MADQPRISLAPKSKGALSKSFSINGVGQNALKHVTTNHTNMKFSVCISYSIDGGNTFKKIVSDFYVNNETIVPVEAKGQVNNSLRQLFSIKPDAMDEPWWILHFSNNVSNNKTDTMQQGILYDYQ